MHDKDSFLREQFSKLLHYLSMELIPEDTIISDFFLTHDQHMSIEEIAGSLQNNGHPEIDISFVRRTMRLLCNLGVASRITLDNRTIYEHHHLDSHHDHLVCVHCGKIKEFTSSRLEEEQLSACCENRFMPLSHRLEIKGICSGCSARMPSTRSLSSCIAGEVVEIFEILGGKEIRKRLTDLGLTRGIQLNVISTDGPVSLEIRGSRIAIGLGQAAKITVKTIAKENRP